MSHKSVDTHNNLINDNINAISKESQMHPAEDFLQQIGSPEHIGAAID